jgi:2-keto-4-pentenoate hydratase/2-oxohepta-3-ene-1,7-dioic acid hydratase in catechol pathway
MFKPNRIFYAVREIVRLPQRQLSTSGSGGLSSEAARIVRFRSTLGEEHFGVFADPQETRAFIGERQEDTGKLKLTKTIRDVDMILPPVDPPAIFCIGLNYRDHAKEVKMDTHQFPIVFSKTFNTLTGHLSAIVIPKVASDPPEVDFEAELAVVIGRECKDVSAEAALDYVAGYTIANDVTARRWQGKRGGGQWTRSKCFDTFLPLGPFLVPKKEVDVRNL